MGRLDRTLGLFLCLVVGTGIVLFIYLNNTQKDDMFKNQIHLSDLAAHLNIETKKDEGPSGSVRTGYCNFPKSITLGSEGLPPTEYVLVSVIALVRHGNRLPMPTTPTLGYLKPPIISCVLNATASEISTKLVKEFIDKTDVTADNVNFEWPFDLRPNSARCGPADLTQIGVEQHIQVGHILREAYGELLELSQANLKVVSTVRSRTYHSAVALVFGLLRDKVDYGTLNIESSSTTEFCRLKKELDCVCPRSVELLAVGEKTLRGYKRNDSNFKIFNKTVYETMGTQFPVRAYYPWKAAHDMMISRICRGDPLPCGFTTNCLTEKDADRSWRSLNFYHQMMSSNKDMILSAKLLMFPFIRELVTTLANHSSQSVIEKKFTVYSGHDNTIIPFLLALEFPLDQWPPFASRLVFELYKPLPGSHYSENLFKLVYNGKDITKYLKFCITTLRWTRTGCVLSDLNNFYQNMLPLYLNSCK